MGSQVTWGPFIRIIKKEVIILKANTKNYQRWAGHMSEKRELDKADRTPTEKEAKTYCLLALKSLTRRIMCQNIWGATIII